MSSKPLSSQRSVEDSDLLERSTKKSKHRAGDPAVSAMEIVDESPSSEEVGGQAMESVEVVAETPLGNQESFGCPVHQADQEEVITETPTALPADPVAVESSPASAGPVDHPPVRSYLETESCPTCPKQGDQDDPALAVAVEMATTTHGNGATVANVGATGTGSTFLHGSRPYGPWMIATRRERRSQGGPQGFRPAEGVQHRGTTGPVKETVSANGSRFALLENEAETENLPNQVIAETGANPPAESRPTGLGGRSRRANVIVNERQIQNERNSPRPESEKAKASSQGQKTTGSCSRRAAEEDEHVVNRGMQGGKVVSSTVIQNGDSNVAEVPLETQPPAEHHGDPPGGFDDEGDVIMDEDSPISAEELAGGDATPVA
nr:uncharacterized protein LOC109156749 [Ipomoea trifida]